MVAYCNDIWNLYYKAEYEGLNGFLYISITGIFIDHLYSIIRLARRPGCSVSLGIPASHTFYPGY